MGRYAHFEYVPEDDYDYPVTADVTEEEMNAFYADMDAIPVDLPTEAEVDAMAKSLGLEAAPF